MVDVYRFYTFTKEFQNLKQHNQYQLLFLYTQINDIEQCAGNTCTHTHTHKQETTTTKREREEGFRIHKEDYVN